jgi:hypothetical protein
MIFKEALSKKALVEFGNLGKLIKLGYIPLPEQPDRESYALDEDVGGVNRLDYLDRPASHRVVCTIVHFTIVAKTQRQLLAIIRLYTGKSYPCTYVAVHCARSFNVDP